MNRLDTNLHESAFDIWSDEMSYWLGFIAADGSIKRDRAMLSVRLTLGDKEHLEKLRIFIGSELALKDYTYKKYKYTELAVTSKYLKDRLVSLGILPNKSNQNIDFLSYVPHDFKLPFILGYFDGDGCWVRDVKKSQVIGINFCGNFSLLSSIQDYMNTEHSFTFRLGTLGFMAHSLDASSLKDICKFAECHASLGDLALQRKRELSLGVLNQTYIATCTNCKKVISNRNSTGFCNNCFNKSRTKSNKPTSEELAHLLKTINNYSALGRHFGVSDNTIRKWAKSYGLLQG